MTTSELEKIIVEREQWAKEAREKDLHGSAREWELTVSIARELVTMRKQFGAVAD